MKNKSNRIIVLYILASLFVAIAALKLLRQFTSNSDCYFFGFIKDVLFILITGLLFRFIFSKNDKRNDLIFENINKSNEKIKESNEKYNIVAKATSDTIWDWRIQQDELTWNKGIKGIYGYAEHQVENNSKWWFDNIHPEDSIKMSIKLYSFLEEKTEKWQDQYRFKCADNTYKYVLDRGFILKDEEGKAVRMIGAIQDITKQKEEENRLKLLETVFTEARDSILITEAKANKDEMPIIVFANPAYSLMSGYDQSEIIGKSFNFFLGKKSNITQIEILINSIINRKECYIEIICYKKDQSEYWVRLSFIPVYNTEQELSHWISIQRDITDEKKSEKEKEILIRELILNNKDLKQFSYITSHNLRAPLSNLTGLLNLINDIEIDDVELKEILVGFKVSTNLLNDTINDLAKVITIKDSPLSQMESLSIRELFNNILNHVSYQLGTIKPLLNIDYGEVVEINTNKVYFESILLNLLTNALKYRSKERDLIVNISIREINNTIVIDFKDNGIGIDLERNKDKIFGLYQRFHNYPDSKGLGLYLVKSQIETMGGTIAIKSEVDKGTAYVLTFKNY